MERQGQPCQGTKEDIRGLNAYLDTLERKVADAHLQLVKDGTEITAESLKLKYLGKDVQRRYLMETFTEHNRKMEALLGKGFKPNTLKGYNTSVAHLTWNCARKYRLINWKFTLRKRRLNERI